MDKDACRQDIFGRYQEQMRMEELQEDPSRIYSMDEDELDRAIQWYRVKCAEQKRRIKQLKKELKKI